jgi:hypothetical protein
MADKGLFVPYKRRIFIETGTQTGSGVNCALSSGFEEVYSIEIDKNFYDKAVETFKNNPNVHLFFGDSKTELPKILKLINEPATIWLDAHTTSYSPIIEELEAINNHHIKNHIILIDDCKNFQHCYGKMGFHEVVKHTQQINLNYKIQLVTANKAYPQNVLVAKEEW